MPVIIKPLSVQRINHATPEQSPLRYGEGLALYITPTSRTWRLDYVKPFTRKRTLMTLGRYPDISLKEARELRAHAKSLLAQDIDPQEYRKQKRQAELNKLENTFHKVAVKWKAFKSQRVVEKTMFDDWRRLDKHVFPKLADVPVTKINSRLLVELMQPVYKKGQTSVIEKCLRTIEAIMDYAENIGYISSHNCHKAKKAFHYKPTKKKTTIPLEELPQFVRKMIGLTLICTPKVGLNNQLTKV